MTLILDTSILIGIERGNRDIINRLEELSRQHMESQVISFITYYEFYRGIAKNKPSKMSEALTFLNKFTCLETTTKTARILATLDIAYREKGKPMLLADLIIASQTLEHQVVLVTADKDFAAIEEIEKVII